MTGNGNCQELVSLSCALQKLFSDGIYKFDILVLRCQIHEVHGTGLLFVNLLYIYLHSPTWTLTIVKLVKLIKVLKSHFCFGQPLIVIVVVQGMTRTFIQLRFDRIISFGGNIINNFPTGM